MVGLKFGGHFCGNLAIRCRFFCKQNKVIFFVSMDSIADFVFTKDLVFLEGLFDGCYCVGN